MTAVALDPAAVIATAIRELVDSVRELVDRDTDDPGVLDELSRLLGRARRKVNKAKQDAVAPAPSTPATTAAPAAAAHPSRPAAPVTEPSRVVRPVVIAVPARAVTVAIRPTRNGPGTRRDLQARTRTPGVAMSQPQPHVTKPTRPAWLWVLIAIIVVAIGVALINELRSPSVSNETPGKSAIAERECRGHVDQRLKAPASARYGDPRTTYAAGETADYYTVTGTVDAENSFGAMLRRQYTCKLTAERDGTWYLLDLSFADR